MANSLTFTQSAETFVFIASSTSRPKRAYGADGKATDAPKVDAKGRPLYGFDAVAQINGQEVQVNVEAPTPLPENIPFGTVWVAMGDKVATTIRATSNGNFASLVVKAELDGFEPLKR